eukprot:300760-Amphidinium_carterae.1
MDNHLLITWTDGSACHNPTSVNALSGVPPARGIGTRLIESSDSRCQDVDIDHAILTAVSSMPAMGRIISDCKGAVKAASRKRTCTHEWKERGLRKEVPTLLPLRREIAWITGHRPRTRLHFKVVTYEDWHGIRRAG